MARDVSKMVLALVVVLLLFVSVLGTWLSLNSAADTSYSNGPSHGTASLTLVRPPVFLTSDGGGSISFNLKKGGQ